MQVADDGLGLKSLDKLFSFLEALINTEVDESNFLALEALCSIEYIINISNRRLAPRSPEIDDQNFTSVMRKACLNASELIYEALNFLEFGAYLHRLDVDRDQIGVLVDVL